MAELKKPFEVCDECGHAWEAHSEAEGCVQHRTVTTEVEGEEVTVELTCKCMNNHGRTFEALGVSANPADRQDVTLQVEN